FERDRESQKIKKTQNLQDKSQRDYFQEVLKMGQNEVFISNIDLNVEHEKVEVPHKSVIRLATPIYRNEKFMGILIINVFMDAFLQNLISSTLYDISLVNEEGYFIKHHKKELAWTKADIKDEAREKKHLLQPLFVGAHKIDMLLVENEATLQKTKNYNNKMIGVILLFAVIMALLFTAIFTKALKNIFDLVALQAQRLELLLSNQSKLAELGEMVANIAHQWRQPLTRVSLILQNLGAFKAKEKMSDKLFNDSMQSALSQIEFMSNTVDNFKDFYKNDTNKVEFFIEDALQSVLNIIGEPMRHSNIKLSINSSQKTTLFANKNEFSQVLLNLIVNAKDAIEERAVQDGKIDINIREENSTIIIEVCDNALGIEDELKEKIFDPYFSTKRDKGTGIGLYLAKTIIEDKMGGKLSVDNSQEGAVFTIKL
ncbi:MAG: HAMP domain-containing sensor histidine kinase, partial [Sulfurimonas sp.]|uniref:sensor histidine kinase n=1 Tax=Sulfurimonas sp. TaxID=2022749 RepID=UPI0028CF3C9B